MSVTTIVASGDYTRRENAHARGKVIFRPIVARGVNAGEIIVGNKVTAVLDTVGTIAQDLVADDNGYQVTEKIVGCDAITYEIPGNADIDLVAAPQPPPDPPGSVVEIAKTSHTITLADVGRRTILIAATEIVVSFPDDDTENLPVGSEGVLVQGGAGQIRVATIGDAIEQHPDDDVVPTFLTRVRSSAIAWAKDKADFYRLDGDMEIPE